MTTALEARWQDVILKLERTYSPTKYDTWRSQLSSEIVRQTGIPLERFDVYDVREYDSLTEARQALIEMWRTGQYLEAKPPATYEFINVKTGERVKLSEHQLESQRLIKLAPSSLYRLINNRNKTIGGWRCL